MSADEFLTSATAALALVFSLALFDQWRERRGAFQLAWALGMLFGIAAATEAGRLRRLERDAVPDVVPHRCGVDGRLVSVLAPRSCSGRPASGMPRAVPVPGRPVHIPRAQPPRVRRRGLAAAAVLHRRSHPRPRGRCRDVLPERALAGPRGRRRRWSDGAVARADGHRQPAAARLRGGSHDWRTRRRHHPGSAPAVDAVHEHHGLVRAHPWRGVLDLRVHAKATGAAVLAGPQPARRRVPVQPAHRPSRDRGELRRLAAGHGTRAAHRSDPQPGARPRSRLRSGRSSRPSPTR